MLRNWIAALLVVAAFPLSAQLQQGIALYEQGRYEEAKRTLAPLTKDVEALKTLGVIAMRQGNAELAVELLEKAAELNPRSAQVQFHLGEALGAKAQQASMFTQARLAPRIRAQFEKAAELDPNFLDPRFGLIDFYMIAPGIMGGSEEKAIQQAAEIKKRNRGMGHRAYARIYSRQKKTDLVRKEYHDYLKADPNSADAHQWYATFLAMTDKKYNEAFAAIEKALKLDPGFMPATFRLGQIAAESGTQLARGEESLKKYLAYKPKDNEPSHASAFYYLGMVLEKQGKKAEAKQAYANALRFNPQSKTFKEAVARVS